MGKNGIGWGVLSKSNGRVSRAVRWIGPMRRLSWLEFVLTLTVLFTLVHYFHPLRPNLKVTTATISTQVILFTGTRKRSNCGHVSKDPKPCEHHQFVDEV